MGLVGTENELERPSTASRTPKTSQNSPKTAAYNSTTKYFLSGHDPIGVWSKLTITWHLESGRSPSEKPRFGSFPEASKLKLSPPQERLSTIPVNRNGAMVLDLEPLCTISVREVALRATDMDPGSDQWLI